MKKFLFNACGATAIEYAFIAMLISIVVIVALQFIGTETAKPYNKVGGTLQNAASG